MRRIAILAIAAVGLLACDDGTTPGGIGNDVEPRTIEGGGTGDGPIDGRINVTALDDETGDPVSGAFVMLGPGPAPEFSGTTGADGRITFRDGAIKGPQQLTVMKADYPVSQMQGLDAANITISLGEEDEGDQTPDPPDTATITGTVSGVDSLAEPAAGSFRVGMVSYTIPGLFDEDFQWVEQDEAGQGQLPPNMVSPDFGAGDASYTLRTWVGRQAVYVLAGVITPGQGGEETTFEMSLFGIVRGVETTKDATVTDVDLVADIPLDQASAITVNGIPAGTNRTDLLPIIDLGDDGQIMMQSFTDENEDGTYEGLLPDTSDPDLDGMVYQLVARSYNEECTGQGEEQSCEELPPSTMTIERDLAPADLATATLDLLAPPGSLGVDTDSWTFSFSSPSGADLLMADIDDDATGDRVYNVILLEGGLGEFGLTQFPAEAGFAGLSGDLVWAQNAAVFTAGIDPNDIAFDDFQDLLVKMSGHEKRFTAP